MPLYFVPGIKGKRLSAASFFMEYLLYSINPIRRQKDKRKVIFTCTAINERRGNILPALLMRSSVGKKGMHPGAGFVPYLAIENNVLTSTQHGLATNFVPRGLRGNRRRQG